MSTQYVVLEMNFSGSALNAWILLFNFTTSSAADTIISIYFFKFICLFVFSEAQRV